MSRIRNVLTSALDKIGINYQDGPENSLVFLLNNTDTNEEISFFVSFVPDDQDFVTMGVHILECGPEEFSIAMAIAGNVNATSKVAKVFPLHMPVSSQPDDDARCSCASDEFDGECDCAGCSTDEVCDCDDPDCCCGDDGDMRAHFFVTSQFLWTGESMEPELLTRYINVALAARQDFLQSIREFRNQDVN